MREVKKRKPVSVGTSSREHFYKLDFYGSTTDAARLAALKMMSKSKLIEICMQLWDDDTEKDLELDDQAAVTRGFAQDKIDRRKKQSPKTSKANIKKAATAIGWQKFVRAHVNDANVIRLEKHTERAAELIRMMQQQQQPLTFVPKVSVVRKFLGKDDKPQS